tara:strand:+ start:42 stop:686 length:645 start_codon:yes stop_codon:yes gene_type:complete
MNKRQSNRKHTMHNLGELFKRQKHLGKSQKEAAKVLGIDHRSVSRHIKQMSLGVDWLKKYADYLECEIFDIIAPVIDRQINATIEKNRVQFYENNQERPRLHGVFAASWWWSNKKTIISLDKNDHHGYHYNTLTFYTEWYSTIRLQDKCAGIYLHPETNEYIPGYIERLDANIFQCINFYEHRKWEKLKLKRYAKFICSYDINDLPIDIINPKD